MTGTVIKAPFWRSLSWSLQWAFAVALRHQVTFAAYVAAAALIGLLMLAAPSAGTLVWFLYGFSLTVLALVTHNEVLRGHAGLDAETLGRGGGRVVGYVLDTVLIVLFLTLITVVPAVAASLLVSLISPAPSDVAAILLAIVAVVALLVLFGRLSLRLPSRALGAPLPWRQVWSLGSGNTLGLVLGPVLLALPLSAIELAAQLLISDDFATLVQTVLLPVQVLLTCAFLSVMYGQLRPMPEPSPR